MVLLFLGLVGSFVAIPLLPVEFSIPLSIMGGYFAFLLFIVNCEGFLYAMGDFIERIKYPDIALAEKITRMDENQIALLERERRYHVIFDEDDEIAWVIKNKVKFPLYKHPDINFNVSDFLDFCGDWYPDFPTVRKSDVYRVAFRDLCRDKEWCIEMPGQNDRFIVPLDTIREYWRIE